MPSYAHVQELIAYVEQGRFLDALHKFYHNEAAMQENSEPPRKGLSACLESEARFLATVQTFHEICALSFLVDGDRTAIHWVFDLTLQNGARRRLEEIAYQRWEGEKIVYEQFFYNAGVPSAPDSPPLDVQKQEGETAGIACVVVGRHGEITLPAALLRQQTLGPGDRLLITDAPLGLGIQVCRADAVEQ